MFKLASFYSCFIIFGITRSVYSGGMLGPANFIFKSVENCPDAPTGIHVDVSGRKIDRINFGITIEIDSPYDFDDELGLILTSCQHMDGGCKESFYYNDTNACTSMEKLIGDVFADLQTKAGLEGCPFPKGNYKVEDWIFDNEQLDKPLIYGEYSSRFMLTHKGVEQCCVLLHHDVVAKNKF